MNDRMNNKWSIKKPIIVLFFIAGIGILVYLIMLLWNAILPDVIGVNKVNYWQMFGILILSKILFGGSKFGSSHKRKSRHKKVKEKLMNMSEEEKEAFKSEMKSRWDKC